jgi:periplasmic copper chaperone A
MLRRRLLLVPLIAWTGSARGESTSIAGIEIDHPWAEPSVSEAAAMFVGLRNNGPRADRLTGGTTAIAEKVILRELDGSALEYFDLLPRRPVLLRPGRRYIALRGLRRLLAIDDTFRMTLRFAEAGSVEVTVKVEEGPEDG